MQPGFKFQMDTPQRKISVPAVDHVNDSSSAQLNQILKAFIEKNGSLKLGEPYDNYDMSYDNVHKSLRKCLWTASLCLYRLPVVVAAWSHSSHWYRTPSWIDWMWRLDKNSRFKVCNKYIFILSNILLYCVGLRLRAWRKTEKYLLVLKIWNHS